MDDAGDLMRLGVRLLGLTDSLVKPQGWASGGVKRTRPGADEERGRWWLANPMMNGK